jgi:AcrR family transcriptional regulator
MSPPTPSDASAKPPRRYAARMAPQQRRQQLLDAALSVIVEQGYEGVSIEAIARTAGVSRPVIYDHFPNLGRLLQALIEREETYALAQLPGIAAESPQSGDPPELFATGVRRFLDAVASRPDTWRIILFPPEGTPAIVRRQVETSRTQLLQRIMRFVNWAGEQAEIPTELDIEISARVILRFSEEAGHMVLADPERFSPERYERFARTVMELICSHRRPAP